MTPSFSVQGKGRAVKGEAVRRYIQVVEILHPDIGDTRQDHGLQFLDDDRLARARADT